MRVFLTGATGFLGGAIARELIARGHECAALARDAGKLSPLAGNLPAVEGDLFEPESYRAALARFAPDALLHCAWRGVEGAARNDIRQLDNLPAAGRLVEAAIDCGARVVVGVGSQGEYGQKNGKISEVDRPEPTTLYGVTKLAAGNAMLNIAAARGVRAAWGRVFSLYGPGDDGPWLVPGLIRAFREGRSPDLTACEQTWEFTHVRDAASAFAALLETPDARGIFNVGSGAPVNLKRAVLMLRDLVAPSIEPRFGAVPYRPDQVMHLEADIERICGAAGWRPRITLEEGFAETVAGRARTREAA